MQVETFECQETAAEPTEASEEALNLIEELGLVGQRSLIVKSTKTGADTRVPYRVITSEESFVYRTLCPTQVALSKYSDGPVPLRILQIAAHAKSVGLDKLYVWCRPSPMTKDPVLIARCDEYDWSTDDSKTRILGRWGEELETFSVLLKRAVSASKERLVAEAEQILSAVRSAGDAEIVSKGANHKINW